MSSFKFWIKLKVCLKHKHFVQNTLNVWASGQIDKNIVTVEGHIHAYVWIQITAEVHFKKVGFQLQKLDFNFKEWISTSKNGFQLKFKLEYNST